MKDRCPIDKYGHHNYARTPSGVRCSFCGKVKP